ncbi:hypothetical protein Tco_1484965 [Tanacetum coccineum]
MSANDDFSLHDDEELSLHDDASLAGSVPASNKGDAPAKPPQIHFQTLNCLDSEWKFKEEVHNGKDGVYMFLSSSNHQEEQFADEKERKARTLLQWLFQKIISDVFMAWSECQRKLAPSRQGLVESLEKGYDRFQKLLSQLDALGAGVTDEDANHKFLRSLPPAWDNIQKTIIFFPKHPEKIAFLSQAKSLSSNISPCHKLGSYSSYTHFLSKAKQTATPGLADEVSFFSRHKYADDRGI